MGAVGNSSHKEMGTSEENKKSLTERDVCTKFITPALVSAGWDFWWCKDTAAGRKETPFTWQVTLEEVKARNYIKNPNAEAAKHGDPDELLSDYKKLPAEVATARDALRDELAKALESTTKGAHDVRHQKAV